MPRYCLIPQPAGEAGPAAKSLQSRLAALPGSRVLHSSPEGLFVELDDKAYQELQAAGGDLVEFGNPHELQVGTHRIDVRKAPAAARKRLRQSGTAQWRQFVAQFKAPPAAGWLRELDASGLRVTARLGQFGVMLEGDAGAAESLAQQAHVAWMAPVEPAWRISRNLAGAKGRLKYVSVLVSPASATPALVDEIKRLKGRVEQVWDESASPGTDQRVIVAELDAARLPALAAHRDVRWIDHQPATYEPEDERSAQIVAGNLNAVAPPATLPVTGYAAQLTNLGIDGTGVIITINDTGVDTNTTAAAQADLAGRIAFAPAAAGNGDTDGHGTHVAGIAAGNGATGDNDPGGFRLGQGVAPGARIGIDLNMAATSIATFSQTAAQNGSPVMNCSWRVNNAGGAYSALDAVIDRAVRDADATAAGAQALAVVFSAGNSGTGASTLTKQTKNAIVVGNSLNGRPGEGNANDDVRGIRFDSSCGPAADGRLLPTVIAPGTDVVSSRSTVDTAPMTAGVQRPRPVYNDTGGTAHADHTQMSGTSMASPHVAGMCALLIEWWRDRTGGRSPSPAMLKALIVNGAVDCAGGPVGNTGAVLAAIPNSQQGWGRANLRNVVLAAPDVPRGPKVFVDQRHAFTAAGQTFTLRVAVADATRPLRVSLAWTDSPANPAAATMLVNDLDLRVTEVATGRLFLGNVFNNGFSVTGGTRDQLNNVECVYVQVPTGEYEVTVRAASVTMDARPPFDAVNPWQDFALVIDNAERAASAPVSAVTVLDRSGSMISSGYVDVTRTAARTFVDLLRVGDDFGLVSFGSSASVAYSAGGAVADIAGEPERTAARAAIDAIAFGGLTHMGPGLAAGAGLLAGSTGARGLVLLSDGYDNGSPSALAAAGALPAGLPVFSCAMGPLSDQALLEQLASMTGGRYYFMPTIDDLFEIHNYISATLTGNSLVANESAQASASRVDAWVEAGCAEAAFSVTWADPTLAYRADVARKRGDLCVRLRLPNGKLLPPNASCVQRVVGRGNVLLRVADPAPGRWRIEVSTAREQHTRYTAAAYVDSPLKLRLDGLRGLVKRPFGWQGRAEVLLRGEPLPDLRLSAMLTQPTIDLAGVLKQYGKQVPKVAPVKGTPAAVVRLRALVEQLRRKGKPSPFGFAAERLSWRPERVGAPVWSAQAKPVLPGSYNVTVLARGQLPGGRGPFVRKGLASFVAI